MQQNKQEHVLLRFNQLLLRSTSNLQVAYLRQRSRSMTQGLAHCQSGNGSNSCACYHLTSLFELSLRLPTFHKGTVFLNKTPSVKGEDCTRCLRILQQILAWIKRWMRSSDADANYGKQRRHVLIEFTHALILEECRFPPSVPIGC